MLFSGQHGAARCLKANARGKRRGAGVSMPSQTLVASWTPYDWRRERDENESDIGDWREAIRSKVKEETSLRLARAESPSWRSRLEAVKAQMEDSSLKVELAEQEMRRAVSEMRQEQRLSTAQAGARQRSMAEMQELIHGLREEQQQAQRALAVCQQALRSARSVAAVHLLRALRRFALSGACLRWWQAVREMAVEAARGEQGRVEEALSLEQQRVEQLRTRLRSGVAEIEQQGHASRSLQAKVLALAPTLSCPRPEPDVEPDREQVLELQQTLSRKAQQAEAEAAETRQRQLAALRAEHEYAITEVAPPRSPPRLAPAPRLVATFPPPLALAGPPRLLAPGRFQVREEHEEVSRRSLRRAQKAQALALGLVPRVHERSRLRLCWVCFKEGVRGARAERLHAEEARLLRAEAEQQRELAAAAAAAAALKSADAEQRSEIAAMAGSGAAEAARAMAREADGRRREAEARAAEVQQQAAQAAAAAEESLHQQRRAAAMAVANAAEAHKRAAELTAARDSVTAEAAAAAAAAAAAQEAAAARARGVEAAARIEARLLRAAVAEAEASAAAARQGQQTRVGALEASQDAMRAEHMVAVSAMQEQGGPTYPSPRARPRARSRR